LANLFLDCGEIERRVRMVCQAHFPNAAIRRDAENREASSQQLTNRWIQRQLLNTALDVLVERDHRVPNHDAGPGKPKEIDLLDLRHAVSLFGDEIAGFRFDDFAIDDPRNDHYKGKPRHQEKSGKTRNPSDDTRSFHLRQKAGEVFGCQSGYLPLASSL